MATAAVANERNNEKVDGNNASGVSCSIVPWAFQRFSVRFRVQEHVEALVALVAMRTQLSNESGGRLATPTRTITKEESDEESSNGGCESVLFLFTNHNRNHRHPLLSTLIQTTTPTHELPSQ